jgi:hypothetical protein
MNAARLSEAALPLSSRSSQTNSGMTQSCSRTAVASAGWSWRRRSRRNQTIAVLTSRT